MTANGTNNGLDDALRQVEAFDCPFNFHPEFAGWLAKNWHCYQAFESVALTMAQRSKHGSAYAIWEILRYRSAIGEIAGPWKLDNRFRADCSRLAAMRNDALIDFFERRTRVRVTQAEAAA
jgi:hypothetical protein